MGFTKEEFLEAKRLGSPYAGRVGSAGTLKTYAKYLRQMEQLAGKPLDQIRGDDIGAILRAIDAKGLADNTKNTLITIADQAFKWAIGSDRYTGKSPFEAIPRRKAEREIKDVLSNAQVAALLAAMEANERDKFEVPPDSLARRTAWFQAGPSNKFTLMTKLMAYGGLRIGEVLKLKKRDVRDDGVRISTEAGKGGKARLVPLPNAIVRELREYVAAHPFTDYVFYGEAGHAYGVNLAKPMRENTYYRIWKAALQRAGLPADYTPHILRHTAATRVHEATGDLATTQSFLGHSNPATTMIYVRVANERVKKACAAAFGD